MAYVYRHIRSDTGQPFYISIAEASKNNGMSVSALKTRLSGKVKNNTSLILFNDN